MAINLATFSDITSDITKAPCEAEGSEPGRRCWASAPTSPEVSSGSATACTRHRRRGDLDGSPASKGSSVRAACAECTAGRDLGGSPSSQSLGHGVCGLSVGLRRDMAIDVGGDADGRMTEDTGHNFDGDTLGKHDRGGRVAQVVPRHRGKPQVGAHPVPVLANVRVVQRGAPRTREDQIVAALCPF